MTPSGGRCAQSGNPNSCGITLHRGVGREHHTGRALVQHSAALSRHAPTLSCELRARTNVQLCPVALPLRALPRNAPPSALGARPIRGSEFQVSLWLPTQTPNPRNAKDAPPCAVPALKFKALTRALSHPTANPGCTGGERSRRRERDNSAKAARRCSGRCLR